MNISQCSERIIEPGKRLPFAIEIRGQEVLIRESELGYLIVGRQKVFNARE